MVALRDDEGDTMQGVEMGGGVGDGGEITMRNLGIQKCWTGFTQMQR